MSPFKVRYVLIMPIFFIANIYEWHQVLGFHCKEKSRQCESRDVDMFSWEGQCQNFTCTYSTSSSSSSSSACHLCFFSFFLSFFLSLGCKDTFQVRLYHLLHSWRFNYVMWKVTCHLHNSLLVYAPPDFQSIFSTAISYKRMDSTIFGHVLIAAWLMNLFIFACQQVNGTRIDSFHQVISPWQWWE